LGVQGHFDGAVQEGFQASTTHHQGRIVRAEQGATGDLTSTVGEARWSFSVEPKTGWGDEGSQQRSTAGWLAALPVFEPHWQIMMSHGEATGWLEWGGKRYAFERAPTYYEKNWGAGFPKRWFWVQCNSFTHHPGVFKGRKRGATLNMLRMLSWGGCVLLG
jgi:tocopherol cyclase